MTSGCKTGYRSLRIFISFVKLIVVINITEQSNVRSLNGSCASNSLTLVFLNVLRFYLPRSFESLYVSFPVLLKFILGLACGNSHCYRPFSKIPWYSRPIVYSFTTQFYHRFIKSKSGRHFFFWMRLIQALVKLSIDELSAVFLNVLWLASKLL